MKKAYKAIIIFTACLLPYAFAYGQDKPAAKTANNYHLCSEAELQAAPWKIILFREQPPMKQMSSYKRSPQRYVAFYPNHKLGFMASASEIKSRALLDSSLASSVKQANAFAYTLDGKGELDILLNKTPIQSFRCVIISADMQGYKKGDLSLTGNTKEKTQLYEIFRHF